MACSNQRLLGVLAHRIKRDHSYLPVDLIDHNPAVYCVPQPTHCSHEDWRERHVSLKHQYTPTNIVTSQQTAV